MPREQKAVDWIPANIKIPAETETPGPFDLDLFPHVRGVLEALDDTDVRNIILPWAARNAKTTTGISALIYFAVCKPRPSIFASSNQDRTDDDINSKIYPMLESCAKTRDMLLPKHRRNKNFIYLRDSRIRRAFSGSPSTLAGFPACYFHASEISKWTKNKSSEANAIRLIGQRAKLYPFDRKGIYESTPGLKGECNIMALYRKATTQRRVRMVPCPHCGEYQKLVFGGKDEDGPGIKWKKGKNGRSDPILAEESAWYQCVNGCKIENFQRAEMMRAGLWVPEGMSVNEWGELIGEPKVRAKDVGFGPLSSLYSLVISGWGQIAREYLEALDDTEALRDFINSTLAEEWDPRPQTIEPHILAKRMCHGTSAGLLPDWSRFLTAGVDVQENGQRFVYVVSAWGEGGRGQEIKHGEAANFDNVVQHVLRRQWQFVDQGEPLHITQAFVDSGDQSELIYDLTRGLNGVLPVKGSGNKMETMYREAVLAPEKRRNRLASEEIKLIHINTTQSNEWLQRHFEGRRFKDEAEFLLSVDSRLDIDFLDQLLNEQKVREFDKNNRLQTRWVRINTSLPNDYRDALRYSRVAAIYCTNDGQLWNALPPRPEDARKQQQAARRSAMGASESFEARNFDDDFSAR
jgi:phage terminase large subunit GpA-like protein